MTMKTTLLVLAALSLLSVAHADYGRSGEGGLWLGISSVSSDFDSLSVSASVPTRWATLSAAMGRGVIGGDDFGDYWQVSLMKAFSSSSRSYVDTQESGYMVGLFHDKYRTNDETIWGVGFVTGPISAAAMRASSPVVRAFGVYMEGGETLFGATTEYAFSGCGF